MAKEYELTAFEKSDYKDTNGNYWCTAVFMGEGEPVKWVMKAETIPKIQVGNKYYGRIEDWTSSKGKTMPRFYTEKRQDANASQPTNQQSDEYWDDRNAAIRAQWAINQSREYIQHMLGENAKLTEILDTAKVFYGMVDQVSGKEVTEEAKVGKAVSDMVDNGAAINLDEVPY